MGCVDPHVGLGWVSQLMNWVGSGHKKWTNGQLWVAPNMMDWICLQHWMYCRTTDSVPQDEEFANYETYVEFLKFSFPYLFQDTYRNVNTCIFCVCSKHTLQFDCLLSIWYYHVQHSKCIISVNCFISPFLFYSRAAVSARFYALLSSLHCEALAACLTLFRQIKWCCHLTNYELLRWLVEMPSRDFHHYRMINASRSTVYHLIKWYTVTWPCIIATRSRDHAPL